MLDLIKARPVLFYGLVVTVIALGSSFGVDLSADQTGALTATVASVLAFFTQRFTTPV